MVDRAYNVLCENQLLLELLLDLFSTLQNVTDIMKICMKKFDAYKMFLTNLQGL